MKKNKADRALEKDMLDHSSFYFGSGADQGEIIDISHAEELAELEKYRSTGLTPYAVKNLMEGRLTEVSFDVGTEGFIFAINAAFKKLYGQTPDEFASELEAYRSTGFSPAELALFRNPVPRRNGKMLSAALRQTAPAVKKSMIKETCLFCGQEIKEE